MSFRMCLQSQNMQYIRPLLVCLNCKKGTISPYLSKFHNHALYQHHYAAFLIILLPLLRPCSAAILQWYIWPCLHTWILEEKYKATIHPCFHLTLYCPENASFAVLLNKKAATNTTHILQIPICWLKQDKKTKTLALALPHKHIQTRLSNPFLSWGINGSNIQQRT